MAYLAALGRRADRKRYSVRTKFINGDPLTVLKELAGPRCHLPTTGEPPIDTQGPCPSTTMPHRLRSLGLI